MTSPVRRLNHVPLYVAGGAALFMVILVGWIAQDRSNQAQAHTQTLAPVEVAKPTAILALEQKAPPVIPALLPAPPTEPTPVEALTVEPSPPIERPLQATRVVHVHPKPSWDSAASSTVYTGKAEIIAPKPTSIPVGTVIQAILDTGVTTDLPGPVMAHITQAVTDAQGHVLLPDGTQLVGESSLLTVRRVGLVWQQAVLPTGQTVVLNNLPTLDVNGVVGVSDKTQRHLLARVGPGLISAAIALAGQVAPPVARLQSNGLSVPQLVASTSGNQLNQASMQMLQHGMGQPPTLTLRPGFRFQVLVTKVVPLD